MKNIAFGAPTSASIGRLYDNLRVNGVLRNHFSNSVTTFCISANITFLFSHKECLLQELRLIHTIDVAAYFRYVDDILLIYDSHHTDTNNIANDFNKIHPNMKFTAEAESDNRINFLDITLHRTSYNWAISIHRKPTFTDTIHIPLTRQGIQRRRRYYSRHPIKQWVSRPHHPPSDDTPPHRVLLRLRMAQLYLHSCYMP